MEIDESSFIYPGPLPKSKEAAVVMLVDGIEAASRSLPEKTYSILHDLIEKMIDEKINDKQLDNSNLTFNDINIIKATLLEKLINIYHIRIEYPKEEKE
jgi:membrane-associated HD superfamily phosphohydrolase